MGTAAAPEAPGAVRTDEYLRFLARALTGMLDALGLTHADLQAGLKTLPPPTTRARRTR